MIQLSEIEVLSSVHISRLKKKGIMTSDDLLSYYPKEYYTIEDYLPNKRSVDSLYIAEIVELTGTYAGDKVFVATCKTYDNRIIKVSFFGTSKFSYDFIINEKYLIFGEFSEYQGQVRINSPIYFSVYKEGSKIPIHAVYRDIQGIAEKTIKKAIAAIINSVQEYEDYLPLDIRNRAKLCLRTESIKVIHFPERKKDIDMAKRRIMFDVLFKFKFILALKAQRKVYSDIIFDKKEKTREFIKKLPFPLTKTNDLNPDNLGQFEVVQIISEKLAKKEVLNLLIQGDVGSGKTAVALIAAMMFIENDKKVVIMTPTQILAQQIYKDAINFCGNDANVLLYTGAMKTKEKNAVQKKIDNDECNLVIGTHSINNLEIPNLGLLIVDEEHRFGVGQKENFTEKDDMVSYISMSATPIPRTIAKSIYGQNMDILSIKSMPAGRKPVLTNIIEYGKSFFNLMLKEVQKGHQGYIICPIIRKNEKTKKRSVDEVHKNADSFFAPYGIKIGVINGEMKESQIECELSKFKNNEYSILISTTIVEVGVNVPNATIIGISNAEFFGLAQLHQLRGRVGRSSYQSYCYLLTDKHPERLRYMEHSNSGFELAKKDLQLRGVGELFGEDQTGLSLPFEIMLSNEKMDNYIDSIIKQIKPDEAERIKNLLHQ